MSYDPVSDKAHFSTPEDARYSDDVYNHNDKRNGNGIYNDYTVELHPKQYNGFFRVCCFELKNTRKCKLILLSSVLVVILALVLIIVAAAHSSNSKNSSNKTVEKKVGLVAYGPDGNGRLQFSPIKNAEYMPYFNRLEHAMSEYSTLRQLNDRDRYIICNSNMTTVPPGKVCMQTATEFGLRCQHFEMYEISEGRPCVLLVLKLEEGVMPKPFNISQNIDVHDKLIDRYSDASVGISCEGKTDSDKKLISPDKHLGPPIDYNPPTGFPLYYFLQKDRTSDYINPAVMVQFSTLTQDHDVTIKCTAWAENFNNGKPQSSEIYSTEFTIKIERKTPL